MQSQSTDIDRLPHGRRNLLPLTGLTRVQVPAVYTMAQQPLAPRTTRPCSMPLPVPLLLVLIHLPTNLTTRALAALFHTSPSTLDRVIHHLLPAPADLSRPVPDDTNTHPWIIDATPIAAHDQSISATTKNYRRSITTHNIIRAHLRPVVVAGRCRPANRNDVIVARPTVAPRSAPIANSWVRAATAITAITTPRREPHRPDQPR